MCLVIANLDGREIPVQYIRSAYRTNHHGFGIMYVKNNELFMQKGMFSVDQVIGMITKMESQKSPYVAHFRMATQGSQSSKNAHPFHITSKMKGVAMVHNGVFHDSRLTHTREDKSDTHLLADWIKTNLGTKITLNELFTVEIPALKNHFPSDMKSYNKLVFMNGHGQINIMNEGLGTWIDGVWYSNIYSIGGTHAIKAQEHVVYDRACLHDKEKLTAVMNRTLHDNMRPEHVVLTDADNDDEDTSSIIDMLEDDDEIDMFLESFGNMVSDKDKKKLQDKRLRRKEKTREELESFWFEGTEYDMKGAFGSSDSDDTVEIEDSTAKALEAAFADIPEAEDVDESSSSELGSEYWTENVDWQAELDRYRNSASQREQKLLTAGAMSVLTPQEKSSTTTPLIPSYGSQSSYVYKPSKETEIVELLLRP